MTRSCSLLAFGLLSLLLPACGGGGGDATPPTPVAVPLVSDSSRGGYLGYVSASASEIRNLVNSIGVGDNDGYVARRSIRGFVSFDLRALPAGARVLTATLQVYQTTVVGSPYATLGAIRADHVDYGDAVNDWALFEDGDMSQGTTNPPLLAIEYVVP